jgi:Xaa-Pro aminopeptidase
MFDWPFDRVEYADRVVRVREEMARHGLDGVLLTSGPNLTYLSGYPSPLRAGSRPFVFVLPQSGEPILIVHTAREREARGYSWVVDIRTYHELSRAPVETIVDALRDANLIEGRVGAELGPEEALDLPVGDFLDLQRLLPAVQFVDAGPALWTARLRKSPAEVA